MSTPRRGLGRGLEALIPASPAQAQSTGMKVVPGAQFVEIELSKIVPNARQPRSVFAEEELNELVTSIKEVGLLQPIVVRPTSGGKYELVMGERRFRASKIAGEKTIAAIVRETSDEDMLRDALLENLHRAQLNPLEEASAYQQLLDDFGITQEQLADRIGRSRPQISNTLRLLKLSPAVQRKVAAGVISAGHARALVSVTDPKVQESLATRVVAEGISVRALEEIVALDPKAPSDRPKKAKRISAPKVTDLADTLSDHFDTTVKINLGQRKGKISIEFASLDDLERIVKLMNPKKR